MRASTRTVRGLRGLRGPGGSGGTPAPAILNALVLTSAAILENSVNNTFVGALLGTTAGSTLLMTVDAGTRFKLSGSSVLASTVATNFESATTHNITIRETKAGVSNSPRDTILTITVANVAEVTLAALTLDDSSIPENTLAGTVIGNIVGLSSGSTVTMTNDASGRFAIVGTTVVVGATPLDFEESGSWSITLREVHADASNSPRSTNLTMTVTDVGEGGAEELPHFTVIFG